MHMKNAHEHKPWYRIGDFLLIILIDISTKGQGQELLPPYPTKKSIQVGMQS